MRSLVLSLVFLIPLVAQELLPKQMIDQNESRVYNWFDGEKISLKLYRLLERIDKDDTLFCSKKRFHLEKLHSLIEKYEEIPDKDTKERIEKVANSASFLYYKTRNSGCYDPGDILEKDTFLPPMEKNVTYVMENPILDNLYLALKQYRFIEKMGGWKRIDIANFAYLQPGREYDVIPAIKDRLNREGYWNEDEFGPLYTNELKEAVKNFQLHHDLEVDGIIGPATVDAMNVSVQRRIFQILMNIEKARWFTQDDKTFVFVDIPGFFLLYFEDAKPIFRSKVIVGRKKRPTPQMRNLISYAVLNPYWRAPKTIISEDILPHLKNGEFDILNQEKIIASIDPYGKEVVPFESVDWRYFDAGNLPFYFLQLPGPWNFLGFLKIMFPNPFDVYIHDTDRRDLFRYNYRALSSGCVRVQKPIELFYRLYNRKKELLSYRDIFEKMYDRKTKEIGFKKKIPVYLLYLTTYLDEENHCYFFSDIYEIDKRVALYKRSH